MANNENLKPLNELCKEDAKKIQSMGGYARAKKIKELKSFKEYLVEALKTETTDQNGKTLTYKQIGALTAVKKYMKGDFRYMELILKLLGEMPKENQGTVNQNSMAEFMKGLEKVRK